MASEYACLNGWKQDTTVCQRVALQFWHEVFNGAFLGVGNFVTWSLAVTAEQRLREKLTAALNPVRLDIVNESDLHAGHRGSPGTGESHFRILIVSAAFTGQSRVSRHRRVNEILKDDVGTSIHALALSTYAPGEAVPSERGH